MISILDKLSIRTVQKLTAWILVAGLSTVLTSCSSNGGNDGPVLTSPRPPLFGGSGLDADVGGRLTYEEDTGCLLLGGIPVVWPAGASWQSNPPAVKIQGQLIKPGMSVLGSGGYHQHVLIEETSGTAVADAAQACVGPTGEIAQFNLGSDVKLVTAE